LADLVQPGLLGTLELREVQLNQGSGVGVVTDWPAELLVALSVVSEQEVPG